MFGVPQFIDVEDKIVGPLTWKQLGWMVGMGGTALVAFSLFDTTLAIIIAIPIVLIFSALAFYKPRGLPLTMFIGSATLFLMRPKIAVWERPVGGLPAMKAKATPSKIQKEEVVDKRLTREKLSALALLIDTQGKR